nr:zinc finger, CCHC-type [Tanacetum cinerariifolium]
MTMLGFFNRNEANINIPRSTKVKSKNHAPIQITAEHIIQEARKLQQPENHHASHKIIDLGELQDYRLRKRNEYENQVRRGSKNVWVKYARWEESQKDFEREEQYVDRDEIEDTIVRKKREKSVSARSDSYNRHSHSRYTEALSESGDSEGGHWKSRSKKKKSSGEEDGLSQPWVCEETDLFTPRIRYFDFPKTRMSSHIKTYDGSEDLKDHLKNFQAAAKTKQWAMPTWCHMFNSTLTGNARVWFDDLSPESIDSYDDLKKVFLENYLQQKKYIKYPIELHNIKQRDGESTEDFVKRYKLESRDVNGAPEKEQPKLTKKGETFEKDKVLAILMVRPWERVATKKITQSFSSNPKIFFPPLGEDEGTEGLMIIEAEIEGQCVHRIKLQAVPSTAHGMLKILVEGGVITLKISKLVPLECAMVFGPAETPSATKPIAEERVKVAINPKYPKQTVMIGSTLTEGGRNKLCGLLQRNLDIFDWKPADMTGFPRHIVEHRLNVQKGCSPIRQKKRGQTADRNQAIQEEAKNLNAGATYQRLVDKAFHKQIGRNLEVYMDDLVIKSLTEDEIVRDVEETFNTLREINIKLNPKKRAFGVEEGMFLGALKGLELNYMSMEKLVLALVHASKHLNRFGLHGEIISDNGKQFRDDPFKYWEAVIPAEIGMPTLRTAEVDPVGNNEALEINLDLLEERREEAAICEAKSKAKMEKYYNSKVRNTSFKPRDLVYCNNDASRTKDTEKLGPKPDIAYVVGRLSRHISSPGGEHWDAVNRVFKYLKQTMDCGLEYNGDPLVLEGYTDASWITDQEDYASTSGWIFTLGGGAVSWGSKKQSCLTDSAMAVDFMALVSCCKEAELLHDLLININLWPKLMPPIFVHCDSQSTLSRAYNQVYN